MSLSCSCDYDYDWFYEADDDFSTLETKRSRKCASCEKSIQPGETVLACACYRLARCEYEERRFGDEVPMAPKYYCEACGEIYFNLSALGYCFSMSDLRERLQEYWEMTGFDPEKYVVPLPAPPEAE